MAPFQFARRQALAVACLAALVALPGAMADRLPAFSPEGEMPPYPPPPPWSGEFPGPPLHFDPFHNGSFSIVHVRPVFPMRPMGPPLNPWLTPCSTLDQLPPLPAEGRMPRLPLVIQIRYIGEDFDPFRSSVMPYMPPMPDDFFPLDFGMRKLGPPTGTTCSPEGGGELGGNRFPWPDARHEVLDPCQGIVRFDARASRDVDGAVASYAWDFGDDHRSTESVVEHRFATPGYHKVSLSVSDDEGASSPASGYLHLPKCENGKPVDPMASGPFGPDPFGMHEFPPFEVPMGPDGRPMEFGRPKEFGPPMGPFPPDAEPPVKPRMPYKPVKPYGT